MSVSQSNMRATLGLSPIAAPETYLPTLPDFPDLPGASCASADPEAWFPEKGGSTWAAKRICKECPVIAECLTWALEHDERDGVWGGLSQQERARLKKNGTAA